MCIRSVCSFSTISCANMDCSRTCSIRPKPPCLRCLTVDMVHLRDTVAEFTHEVFGHHPARQIHSSTPYSSSSAEQKLADGRDQAAKVACPMVQLHRSPCCRSWTDKPSHRLCTLSRTLGVCRFLIQHFALGTILGFSRYISCSSLHSQWDVRLSVPSLSRCAGHQLILGPCTSVFPLQFRFWLVSRLPACPNHAWRS